MGCEDVLSVSSSLGISLPFQSERQRRGRMVGVWGVSEREKDVVVKRKEFSNR